MAKIRLLARCQIGGGIQEPGFTFDMPEFETDEARIAYLRSLPHTVSDHGNPRAANYRADLHGTSVDAVTGGQYVGPIQQPLRDIPLFEIIDGDQPPESAPVPSAPANPNAQIIMPSGPLDPPPPVVPLTADPRTGEILGAGPLVESDKPAEAGTVAQAAGEPASSQAESVVQESPAERVEDGPAAEGEAHVDGNGDAA